MTLKTTAIHTAGPWQVVPSHDGANHQIRTGDGRFSVYLGSTGAPSDEWSANARLIAAAPDMLEPLRYLVNVTRQLDRLSGQDLEVLLLAEAAIAKAEGL